MTDQAGPRLSRRRTRTEDQPEPFASNRNVQDQPALASSPGSKPGPSLQERRRMASPTRAVHRSSAPDVLVAASGSTSSMPMQMNRKRRLSNTADMMASSPPFSKELPTLGPIHHSYSSPPTGFGGGRRGSLGEETHPHHNSLLDLLHASASTSSPRSSPLLQPVHHVASPPPGANYGQAPHALLRQAQLASLAPPELSLPGDALFNPQDIDAKWPEPNFVTAGERPSMSPFASPLGTPGSPPLLPLFPSSPGASMPQHASYLKDDKLKLTRFGGSYSPTSSESESDISTQGDDSPMSINTPLPVLDSASGRFANEEERGRSRRRRRSHKSRGSRGSSSSGEFAVGEDGQMDLDQMNAPSSPPHFARPKQPHLAMPERSGWELTDDDEEASEDGSDSDSYSDEDELEDEDLTLTRSSGLAAPAPERTRSPLLMMDIEPELASLPPLDPRAEQQHDGRMFDEKAESEAAALAHDESLSPLERIFILSKSEYREHRSDVSRALPDWLEEVDICEAAEYVLPLLSGLAADDDEVKVGLAQGLDRIMFYFYSRCPLADPEEEPSTDDSDQLSGMAQPMEMDEEPTWPLKHTLSTASSLASDSAAVVDPPHIPVGAFTPILGLLLMEQHIEVSSWARASVVRFLCRLHGKPIPSNLLDESERLEQSNKREHNASNHSHMPYDMTSAARLALEQQILVDVVLGLARLESEDDAANDSMDSTETKQEEEKPSTPVDEPNWGIDSSSKQQDKKDSPDVNSSPDWGMPLRSFNSRDSSSAYAGSTPVNSGRYFSSHMFDNDNEATQGKIASIELISAIAAAECLPNNTLVEVFVPEIEKMTEDKAYRVRSVAASAIGSLSKSLPPELVETVLLPLSSAFAQDEQPMVRRWACLTLPDIFARLSPRARREQAIQAVRHFSQDQSRDVRSALTEICGPLIHSFLNEDIPPELLDWYLGRPEHSLTRSTSHVPEKKFSPLATALSLKNNHSRAVSDPFTESFSSNGLQSDPERAMISAFNLPAVVLTLGRQRWNEIKQFHATLAESTQIGVRRSLAASLHAIADIIGAEQAAIDLPGVFERYLLDTPEIRECIIEHYAAFIKLLPVKHQEIQLKAVHQSLYKTPNQPSSWRLREQAASQLSILVNSVHLHQTALAEHPIFILLVDFLKDETAAVRTAGLSNLTAIWNALSLQSLRAGFVDQVLLPQFGRAESYRHRATFVACVAKIVKSDFVEKGGFEELFLPALLGLASDRIVDVRLALARLVAQYASSTSLQLPPHPLLLQIYRQLKVDPSAMVREALGSKLDVHMAPTNGYRSSPNSRASSHNAFANEEDELMSETLSSSTITDLRSLESADVVDLLRSDDSRNERSPSLEPPSQQPHPGFVKQSSFSGSGRNLYTRELEGFVEVEVD